MCACVCWVCVCGWVAGCVRVLTDLSLAGYIVVGVRSFNYVCVCDRCVHNIYHSFSIVTLYTIHL